MSKFGYEKDGDGIVTITMDMAGPVNTMNAEFQKLLGDCVGRLEKETDIIGAIIASAKTDFIAGADLNGLLSLERKDVPIFMENLELLKSILRRLELLPVPVVAAINGSALGGGYELCLACNRRIVHDSAKIKIGLPEVTLGLLPGGGGIVRLVNMLGIETALPYLLEGKTLAPSVALSAGLVDDLVSTSADLVPAAKAWLIENRKNPQVAIKPWDTKNFRIPGGNSNTPQNLKLAMGANIMLRQKIRGLLPAPSAILDCALEAGRLDFDTACRIESRKLAFLVVSPEAKNMISTFFFSMKDVRSGLRRPNGYPAVNVKKVGILGAGMMGQGIAYANAVAGIDVIVKDVSVQAALMAVSYAEKRLEEKVSRGVMDSGAKRSVLARITATTENADLSDCDAIIEAVYEDMDLKREILRELEPYLKKEAFWGSNTSSLPISLLSNASSQPEHFIGVHFFSPADKMPLIEIILGKETSKETLAKAFDYARQIGKIRIVVNDAPGFYTSRTFGTYLDEGVRMLSEGIHPARIERIGKSIGMPMGPLAIYDEVSLELSRKAAHTWAEHGIQDTTKDRSVTSEVIETMIGQYGRGGRHHGGGFYEYSDDNSKAIWPGLVKRYYRKDALISDSDLRDRLLFRQVIESYNCLEEGVLTSEAEGNVGSILGIGAPAWTGGYLQFANTYGIENFVHRCEQLADLYGDRFSAGKLLNSRAVQAGSHPEISYQH